MDTDIFHDFCGGYEFWNATLLLQDTPEISPCFIDTVLVWVPYGYLWLAFLPCLLFLYRSDRNPVLPFTRLQAVKTVASLVLAVLAIVELVLSTTNGYYCRENHSFPTSVYVACILKTATYLLVLFLQHLMRWYGVKTSGVPYVFWMATSVSAIVPLYRWITIEPWCVVGSVFCVEFALLWVQLVLYSFVDDYHARGYEELDQKACPVESASVLNRVFYNWITKLVVDAYKKTLTSRDLWQQNVSLQSVNLVPSFLRRWKHETEVKKLKAAKESFVEYKPYKSQNGYGKPTEEDSEKTPLLNHGLTEDGGMAAMSITQPVTSGRTLSGASLYLVIVKQFGLMWLEASMYKLISDTFNLLQPLILQELIGIIEARDDEDAPNSPVWLGFTYTVILFCTSMLKSVFNHLAFYHVIRVGLSIKASMIGGIYRKALTISNAARKSSTVGEIVNLMSVDCQRVQDCFTFSHYILALPYSIIVCMVQVYILMGHAMWGGLAVVLICTGLNVWIGRLQQTLQRQILGLKGKRIKILNELVNGIKVIKMYTWEKSFEQKVVDIRGEELKRLWKYAICSAVSIMFAVFSPFMINYVLVLWYTLSSPIHYLDAQTAFVVLSLVNILRGPIIITPFFITGIIQGYVSIGRIQQFLWNDDVKDDNVTLMETGEQAIRVKNGRFTWNRQIPKPTLDRINLKVNEGQIYAVVGQVGTGKSSLISAILGEMEKLGGEVKTKGSIAYVPQEAWIQNLTVRDNILFGKPMDETRYSKVLSGCALLPDLEILSGGDMTEIGEKGINISGGQKQRVSLARAVYSDADIYLMDDPLSAVDSHVGKHLFRNVIGKEGLLKHKTRVLVTHGIHWLPMVDCIIVLLDGQISETGTYEELVIKNGPFAQFLKSYVDQDDDDDDDDEELLQIREKILSDIDAVTSDDNDTVQEKRRSRRRRQSSKEQSFGMSFSKGNDRNDGKQKDQVMSRLIQEEKSQKGSVSIDVFITYARAMGLFSLLMVAVFLIAFQSLSVFSNYWLTYWTEDPLLKNVSLGHTQEYEDRFIYYLALYSVIGVIQAVAIAVFGILALTRMVRASSRLHNRMLTSVLRSAMSFFDTTPVGRIMNRFSSDVDIMDDRLPLTFRIWNIQIVSTIATIIVVSISTPEFMIVIVPVGIVYLLLLKFFLPTARQVKRIESVLRSPIYNHFSETITGVDVIRAYKCAPRFIKESEKRVDTNVKFFFAAQSASRWVGIRLEILGNLLIFAASIFALTSSGLSGADVGLSITYALQITISLTLVVQAVSEMEMNVVSIERVKEYTELATEAAWVLDTKRPASNWPTTGTVQFKQYTTRYRDGLDLVLRGIDCNIASGEKVGIVGRTGAGKSSLTLCLFRLIESAGGSIYIDGVRISDIGLHDLRSKITILPQDPVLFSGSLRTNLDPFGRFKDDALWKALECAHLKSAVERMQGHLEYECGEGGNNLSMGQRQLVCLARTLLHKTKILILDEATAAVDLETDDLIQATIRQQFGDCTILTIAHRLNTVMDYDRVMVMDQGLIQEFDSPTKLLKNRNGIFYGMAKSAGLVS